MNLGRIQQSPQGGGGLTQFFSRQRILQRAVQTPLEKLLGPEGIQLLPRGFVPVFMRKPNPTPAGSAYDEQEATGSNITGGQVLYI